MVNSAREASQEGMDQYMRRPYAPELCEVLKVYPHKAPFNFGGGDRDFDVVDVKLRDIRQDGAADSDVPKYFRALVAQQQFGNMQGSPRTPKVGDLVVVIFLQDNQPLVIANVCNIYQEPVCRPTSNQTIYDIIHKICQYDPPQMDSEKNYINHPEPQKSPVCLKYFDESKDCMITHECIYGYAGNDPTCHLCENIDHVDHGCSRLKVRSFVEGTEHESDQPEGRIRFDHHCGTRVIFDDSGRVRIENMAAEVPKGHIEFDPLGDIVVESAPEDVNVGSKVVVYAPDSNYADSSGNVISCEMQDKSSWSTFRIYKSGDVRATATLRDMGASEVYCKMDGSCWLWNVIANASVEIFADGTIAITSPTAVNITAPIVSINASTINIPEEE